MISILASIVIATAAQGEPQKSLLQQVVPIPTGNNGYEDYLRAADMLDDRLVAYMNWTPERYEELLELLKQETGDTFTASDKPSKEEIALAKRLDGMTRLEVQRETVAMFGKALDLVAAGNRKRVWDPRGGVVDAATLFPEFAKFKSLAKLADTAAFVAFADGQSLRGTKYLLNSYQLGQNLESGVLISHLVAVAIEAIALAGIERHLDTISRADAAMIETTVPNLLSGKPKILNAIDMEQQVTMNSLGDVLKGGDSMEASLWGSDTEDEAFKALTQQMKSLSPARRIALMERARKRLETGMIPVRKRFAGPEAGWIVKPPPGNSEEEDDSTIPADPEAFVDMIVDSTTGLWSQSGSASAKARTQLRLLGLSASVIRFKWDHGKLPTSLAEAAGEAKVKDPLSEDLFQYERQGAWGFRVYSKGAPGIGEIGLKYRRTVSTGQEPEKSPPPTR